MSPSCRRVAVLASAVWAFGLAAPAQTPPTKAPLRPLELLASPKEFEGRTVEIEIVENLGGVGGDPHAQTCVRLPETFPCLLSLVPAAATSRFEAPILSPVRVRGEFLRDDGLTGSEPGYVIRVSSVEPLPAEMPTPVASVAELLARKESWDRRRIVIEGTWRRGFEISSLDHEMWISLAAKAETVGKPKEKAANRVRLTGLLFARPGRGYGHMGAAAMLLQATKVEYLGRGR